MFENLFGPCMTRASHIHAEVLKRQADLPGVIVPEAIEGWGFRVRFSGTRRGCSIAVPPDMRSGFVETALVDFDSDEKDAQSNLVYIPSVGYGDVCRFDDVDELITEVQRLAKLTPEWKIKDTTTTDTKDCTSNDNDGASPKKRKSPDSNENEPCPKATTTDKASKKRRRTKAK